MTKREIVTVVLLGIFTCGIYQLYWFYVTSEQVNMEENERPPLLNYVLAILLGLLTCGIFTIYWYYMLYKKLDKLTGDDNTVLNFLLSIFATPIAGMALAQNQINKYIDRKEV